MGILENRKLEKKKNREREHTRGEATDEKNKMHKQNKIAKKKKENGLYLLVLQSRGNGVSFVVCSFVRVFPFASDPCLIKKKKGERNKKGTSNSHAALEELKRKQRSAVENKAPQKKTL